MAATRRRNSNNQIDFEAVATIYDGILASLSTGGEGLRDVLYGWDCDSLPLFSADIILGMSLIRPAKTATIPMSCSASYVCTL